MRSKQSFHWLIGIFFIGIALAVDRLTKQIVISDQFKPITVIDGVLSINYHSNTNMALSLPLIPILYYGLLAIVFTGLVYAMVDSFRKRQLFEYLSVLFIIGAAISNLIDRVMYGGVIDFIYIPAWSVFNVADIYIVISIIALLIKISWPGNKSKHNGTEKISA